MNKPIAPEYLTANVPLTVPDTIAELSQAMGLSDQEVKTKFDALGMPQFANCIVIILIGPGTGFKMKLYDHGKKEPRYGYSVDGLGQVWQ